jgi:hypothetical protein
MRLSGDMIVFSVNIDDCKDVACNVSTVTRYGFEIKEMIGETFYQNVSTSQQKEAACDS